MDLNNFWHTICSERNKVNVLNEVGRQVSVERKVQRARKTWIKRGLKRFTQNIEKNRSIKKNILREDNVVSGDEDRLIDDYLLNKVPDSIKRGVARRRKWKMKRYLGREKSRFPWEKRKFASYFYVQMTQNYFYNELKRDINKTGIELRNRKKHFLPGFQRLDAIIFLRGTKNNLIVSLTDMLGNILHVTTAGRYFRGKVKRTFFAAESIGNSFGEYCMENFSVWHGTKLRGEKRAGELYVNRQIGKGKRTRRVVYRLKKELRVLVRIKGLRASKVRGFMKGLKGTGIWVIGIEKLLNVPHNGCRKPQKRCL